MKYLSRLLALGALLLLAGCSERGDKAIAYGDELGREWKPSAPKQMRISVENYFTRDVVVTAAAPGLHYELTVGPVRRRYMIVPAEKYEITAVADGDTAGNVHLHVDPDDLNGARNLWVKIRP